MRLRVEDAGRGNATETARTCGQDIRPQSRKLKQPTAHFHAVTKERRYHPLRAQKRVQSHPEKEWRAEQ